jgi:hypothetical protein
MLSVFEMGFFMSGGNFEGNFEIWDSLTSSIRTTKGFENYQPHDLFLMTVGQGGFCKFLSFIRRRGAPSGAAGSSHLICGSFNFVKISE